MKNRTTLIVWDVMLLIGIALFLFINFADSNNHFIVGLVSVSIFSICLKNHIDAYKFGGKIY